VEYVKKVLKSSSKADQFKLSFPFSNLQTNPFVSLELNAARRNEQSSMRILSSVWQNSGAPIARGFFREERIMHIHGNLLNSNAASLYSAAAAAEKAASAQRVADVRKKLMEGALNIDGELNAEEILIRQWSEGNSNRGQGQDQPRSPKNTRTADEAQAHKSKIKLADEKQADKPISTWA
jgi:N-methylhydantoinase B/oxoprolinase/acetone carboxylase alpha subunit